MTLTSGWSSAKIANRMRGARAWRNAFFKGEDLTNFGPVRRSDSWLNRQFNDAQWLMIDAISRFVDSVNSRHASASDLNTRAHPKWGHCV